MEKLTITEALSELNLIKKKVEKKRSSVMGLLVSAKHIKDPFESQGGMRAFIKSEIQSIEDLDSRFIRIKGSIAKANIDNSITVNGFTKTIHDWLIWKRDISSSESKFYSQIHSDVKAHFDKVQKSPAIYKDEAGNTHLVEFEAMVDYGDYLKKAELLGDIFERLDGQLSLKNATIVVDF